MTAVLVVVGKFLLSVVALGILMGVTAGLLRLVRDRRPYGVASTPKGMMAGPSDRALRQARRFYATDHGAPPVVELDLISNADATPSVRAMVPRPVREGIIATVIDRTMGPVRVRVDLVIPRPQDGLAPEWHPFQYIGTVVATDRMDPPRGQQDLRIQFDHESIWATNQPVPVSKESDGPA